MGCVDDKCHYANNIKKGVLKHLLEALEKLIRTWDELLTFVGNQLEMDKIDWYLIEWDFDSTYIPYIKEQTHPLNYLDVNVNKSPSKQLQPYEPATYLGVTSYVNGSQEAQYCELLQKIEHSARNISTTYLSHYYSHVYKNCSILPNIPYPLSVISLTSKHFDKIHTVLFPASIASKGCNRYWNTNTRSLYY